jgi:hypothetical protein
MTDPDQRRRLEHLLGKLAFKQMEVNKREDAKALVNAAKARHDEAEIDRIKVLLSHRSLLQVLLQVLLSYCKASRLKLLFYFFTFLLFSENTPIDFSGEIHPRHATVGEKRGRGKETAKSRVARPVAQKERAADAGFAAQA